MDNSWEVGFWALHPDSLTRSKRRRVSRRVEALGVKRHTAYSNYPLTLSCRPGAPTRRCVRYQRQTEKFFDNRFQRIKTRRRRREESLIPDSPMREKCRGNALKSEFRCPAHP